MNYALVAIGLIGGAVIVGASHSIWHRVDSGGLSGAPVPQVASTALRSDTTSGKDSDIREQNSAQETDIGVRHVVQSSAANSDRAEAKVPSELPNTTSTDSMGREIPEVYTAMVEPRPRPERLTTQELYQGFVDDSRDESWAYPMELGINQYISERGGTFGAEFEFVECRSRYCTIAGVVYGGGQPTVNEFMAEMTQRGWWQTYGGRSTVGSRIDDEYRFVSIFPRTPDDSSRGESPGQSIEKGTGSKAQSVDS